ncbi:MAG: hypothetical protein WCD57_04865 [Acidobacteriaceae bacterium]
MVLADWYQIDPTDKVRLQEVGGHVMAGQEQRELNRRLIGRVEQSKDVAVDGLRHPIDYESLLAEFGNRFSLIFVDTPLMVRFERTKDRYTTYEQFLAADSRSVESNIDLLRPLAVATISGTILRGESIAELRRLVSSFRQRIGA